MSNYIPITNTHKQEMLRKIGINSVEELFCDIPGQIKLNKLLDIPAGLSEQRVLEKMSCLADKNKVYRSIFRGAGAYRHYIPAVVDSVAGKEEFVTAYTPYQPEISQ
ncbi:MAG: aminomethyl-transferring glycine dehydrogenase, partial [Clostridiaceae bacterium]|nr:aminomethyl-transferring glycine dehydrogenase [Clostridiaceae bacterium]